MRVLAIETSDRIGALATLEVDGDSTTVVGNLVLPAQQRSAQSLVPTIKLLLAESHWQAHQLHLICVATGPGSFTGLRIGVTAAKSLAYATGAELVGVHTLAAIAAGVTQPWNRLWTILDAQRRELFVALFDSAEQLAAGEDPVTTIIGSEDWLKELRAGDVVSGPPLAKLAAKLPGGVIAADSTEWLPKAAVVGRIGIAKVRNGQTVEAMQLVPQYYRKSAAEEKAELNS